MQVLLQVLVSLAVHIGSIFSFENEYIEYRKKKPRNLEKRINMQLTEGQMFVFF